MPSYIATWIVGSLAGMVSGLLISTGNVWNLSAACFVILGSQQLSKGIVEKLENRE